MVPVAGIARLWLLLACFNLLGAAGSLYFYKYVTGYPVLFVAGAGVLLTAAGFLFHRNRYYLKGRLWCAGALLLMAAFGAWRMAGPLIHSQQPLPVANEYAVEVTGFPEMKSATAQAPAKVLAYLTGDEFSTLPEPVQVLVYFHQSYKVNPGERWVIKGKISRPAGPSFPGGFDYAGYLSRKGIGYTLYAGEYRALKMDSSHTSQIKDLVWKARTGIESRLEMLFQDSMTLSIAKAMTLGMRMRDAGTRAIFEQTGTIHILAVSGLHVGVVLWVFTLLAAPLRRLNGGRYIFMAVTLAGVWSFAFVTGLPASACRAALMFTVLAVGEAAGRGRPTVGQALMLTVFILTAYNPAYFFDLGFQLSVAAVAGLALITPLIDTSQLRFSSPRLKYFADLFTASFAAQVAVLPFVLYYFGAFPLLFLLSNAFAVPAAFLLLTGIMGAVTVSFFAPGPAQAVVWCVEAVAEGLLKILNMIAAVPGAVLTGYYLSFAAAVVLALCIVCTVAFFRRPAPYYLYSAFLCGFGFVAMMFSHAHEQKTLRRLLVFDTPGYTAVEYIAGTTAYLLSDLPAKAADFKIKPFEDRHSVLYKKIINNNDFVVIPVSGKRVIRVAKRPFQIPEQKIPADVLIVSKDAFEDENEAGRYFNCSRVIFDGSCMLFYKNNSPEGNLPVAFDF